jgi:Core-2/I-Branching enzyme
MAQIAYLVLTHGLPYQTIDFLWSLWREEDAYFVHVDRKSPAVAGAGIAAIAAAYPNIHVVPSEICTWGGFSLVEASLRCLQAALATDGSWSHAVLVSGTHLPLRRAASLAGMLDPEFCYLTLHDFDLEVAKLEPPNWWSGVARRLTFEYHEVPGLGHIRGPARIPPLDVTFFWGSQWWILSRAAAEFVCACRQSPLAKYFRISAFPDEVYFQTILANSQFKDLLRHQQITWQRWTKGRPQFLSDEDIATALSSKQFFARKADEVTMRDESGILERTIAALDRASWVESVTRAFSKFLPPSMFAVLEDGYRLGGDSRGTSAENDMETRSLINETSKIIRDIAAEHGLTVQLSSRIPAFNEAVLVCEFPDSRTRANYLLILRFCNLEIAWMGLYLRSTDLDKAPTDLQDFADRRLIDFNFPPVAGFHPYRDLLEYSVRRKGVVGLGGQQGAETLEAVIREYLEILSRIPGMIEPKAAG